MMIQDRKPLFGMVLATSTELSINIHDRVTALNTIKTAMDQALSLPAAQHHLVSKHSGVLQMATRNNWPAIGDLS